MKTTRKYPMVPERVAQSPFKTVARAREVLARYRRGESIGFTYLASLRSMGLVKRVDGTYRLGPKYESAVDA